MCLGAKTNSIGGKKSSSCKWDFNSIAPFAEECDGEEKKTIGSQTSTTNERTITKAFRNYFYKTVILKIFCFFPNSALLNLQLQMALLGFYLTHTRDLLSHVVLIGHDLPYISSIPKMVPLTGNQCRNIMTPLSLSSLQQLLSVIQKYPIPAKICIKHQNIPLSSSSSFSTTSNKKSC